MAQEKFLRLRKEHVDEPCVIPLVVHDVLDVKLIIKLLEKVLLSLDPFVFLTAEAFEVAQSLDQWNFRHLFYSRSLLGKILSVFFAQRRG